MDGKESWTQAATGELGEFEQRRFMSDIHLMPMLDRTQAAKPSCPSMEVTGSCTCPPKGKGEMHHGTGDRMMVYNWETHLLHEDNCFSYDGDDAGAKTFQANMDGKTPKDFAEEFSKKYDYRGLDSNDHLVEQLLKFWAERVALWKKEYASESHARAAWYRRVKEFYGIDAVKPLCASVARRLETDSKLHAAIRHKGFPDCDNRDEQGYCICINRYIDNPVDRATGFQMVVMWEMTLLQTKHCLLYVGDEDSKALSKDKTGKEPIDITKKFLKESPQVMSIFEIATTEEDLIHAMLEFWASRAKQWRNEGMSHEAASEDFFDRLEKREYDMGKPVMGPGKAKYDKKPFKADKALGISQKARKVVDADLSVDHVAKAYEFEFGDPEHICVAHVAAELTKNDMIKFTPLHFHDCHPECGQSKRDMRALWVQLYASYYDVYRELTASTKDKANGVGDLGMFALSVNDKGSNAQ